MLALCNTETMSLHLAGISLAVAPGAHAAVLMDQAGWHMTGKRIVPANIIDHRCEPWNRLTDQRWPIMAI